MHLNIFDIIQNKFSTDRLKFFELSALALFLIFLPSFEAPKNIFLGIFLILYFLRSINLPKNKWISWDWIFLLLILSAFLSAEFSGISGGSEWKGFRALTFWIIFGWALSRNDYDLKEKYFLFTLTIFATIPPLLWGLDDHYLLFFNSGPKERLSLHSVGHVNHSAIYLCLIFGASLAYLLSAFKKKNKFQILSWVFLTGLFYIALIISESRGSFGIAIFLSIFFIIAFSLKAHLKIIGLVLFALVNLPLFYHPPQIVLKHEGYVQRHDTLSSRNLIWETSIEASKLHPLFGLGNGNASRINFYQIKSNVEARGEVFDENKYEIPISHPHNIYIANLVERGFFGLTVFLSFLALWGLTLINSYIKLNKNIDARNKMIYLGSLSSFIVIFGVGFVNTTFHHENALLALFFLGLYLSEVRKFKIIHKSS